MRWKGQAGYTLVEVIIALTIMGLIMAPVAGILYQLVWMPGQRSDVLALLHNVRQAVRWIEYDARQARSFTPGSEPDYATFNWVDHVSDPPAAHTVRYYYSGADTSLLREETGNGSPETIVVSDNIQDYSDISIEEASGLVTASVTATIGSARETTTRTASTSVQMRPVLPATPPTPPPFTLAWDDFESGGWSGGTGWLDDWYHEGDASITWWDDPYEGSYHLRLRRANGYVDRSLDLSGQANVRLQFWARADSFEAGEFAECLVSPDGTTWYTVRTWVDGEDDDVYRFEDLDLSSYSMTSGFWIAFDAEMSGGADRLWVDDLKLVRTW